MLTRKRVNFLLVAKIARKSVNFLFVHQHVVEVRPHDKHVLPPVGGMLRKPTITSVCMALSSGRRATGEALLSCRQPARGVLFTVDRIFILAYQVRVASSTWIFSKLVETAQIHVRAAPKYRYNWSGWKHTLLKPP